MACASSYMASSAQYLLSAVHRFHSSKPQRPHPVLFFTSIGDHNRFISLRPRASQRYQDYSQDRDQSISAQDAVVIASDPRTWIGGSGSVGGDVDVDVNDDDDEEEDDDRSWDLLARLLKSMFRKISRQARKVVRPVLPASFSEKFVRFTVNGVLILAFLWILKAFLEVVCMVGSMVFVGILVVRGTWSAVSYMKENQFNYTNRITHSDYNSNIWNGVQPSS